MKRLSILLALFGLLNVETFAQASSDNGIMRLDEFRYPKKREIISIPDVNGLTVLKCDFHMHTVFTDGHVWPNVRNQEAWQEGLDALAITASGYSTGEHITFYQARGGIKAWRRTLRKAVPASIGVHHLLASSAIPFIFPAQALLVHGHTEWCGDGSMRHLAPISPAIHLGAEKIFVVGTSYRDETHPELRRSDPPYPSLAQIGGHALFSIFQDTVASDFESMERVNHLLAQLPPNVLKTQSLRPVSTLAITPSRSLDELAMAHLKQMPRAARSLFAVLGVSSRSGSRAGAALISYLLFEGSYTQALIELGRADTMRRAHEVHALFKDTPG